MRQQKEKRKKEAKLLVFFLSIIDAADSFLCQRAKQEKKAEERRTREREKRERERVEKQLEVLRLTSRRPRRRSLFLEALVTLLPKQKRKTKKKKKSFQYLKPMLLCVLTS